MPMQGLRRDLTPLNAFGITFSTVGVLWVFTNDPLGHALVYGGPITIVWAWVLVSLLNVITALCLAEMAACMPAAIGSLYVFTARLAPWHSKALSTWVNAWANMAGALGATSYYALVTVRTINSAARLARVAASPLPYDAADPTYSLTQGQQFGIYCAIVLTWLGLVAAPITVTAGCITATSLWQIVGGVALFAALLVLSPGKQPASEVLARWQTRSDISGISNVPYSVVQGLLYAITAQTGYETVLYFCDEMIVHRRRRVRSEKGDPQQQQPLLAAAQTPGGGGGGNNSVHARQMTSPPGKTPAGAGAGSGAAAGAPSVTTAPSRVAASSRGGGSGGAGIAIGGGAGGAGGAGCGGPGAAGGNQALPLPCSSGGAQQQQQQQQQLHAQPQQLQSPQPPQQQQQQQLRRLWSQRQGGGGRGRTGGWRTQWALPESIFGGLAASCALSLVFLLMTLASVPSLWHAVEPRNETLGRDAMSQIVYDILKARYGSGGGSPGLISVLVVGVYGTGLVSAAGAARKLWAMASDGFVPAWLSGVSTATRVPVRATAAATLVMLLPGLLLLAGDQAIAAAVSFVPLAVNTSYLLPIALRLLPGSAAGYDAGTRRVRQEGGFTLGVLSRPLFWVSSVWLVVSMLISLSPPAWPLLAGTTNWALVATAALAVGLALSWWFPRWGARRWFRGLASVAGRVSYC